MLQPNHIFFSSHSHSFFILFLLFIEFKGFCTTGMTHMLMPRLPCVAVSKVRCVFATWTSISGRVGLGGHPLSLVRFHYLQCSSLITLLPNPEGLSLPLSLSLSRSLPSSLTMQRIRHKLW